MGRTWVAFVSSAFGLIGACYTELRDVKVYEPQSSFVASQADASSELLPGSLVSVAKDPSDSGALALLATRNESKDGSAPATVSKFVSFARARDSGKIDKVSSSDGELLTPDGIKDQTFDVIVSGPFVSFFLISVDSNGDPDGRYQADTLTGRDIEPSEFAFAHKGEKTFALGVFEGDIPLNHVNGSVNIESTGVRTLTFYVSDAKEIAAGKRVRVCGQDKGLSLVFGPMLTK